jgi:hypothetical protein
MRRVHAAAVGIAALLVALTGCGVQPTGVNVASANPISAAQNTPSSSPAATGPTYPVRLFLTSRGTLVPVTRSVGDKPSIMGVIDQIRQPVSADESELGYTTSVPPDLVLKPTTLAHEYIASRPLTPTAVNQIVCTLDVYWLQHPDNRTNPSTHIIVPGQSYGGFDDCLSYAPMAAGQTGVYPSTATPTVSKAP